jgi:hypothetical protein
LILNTPQHVKQNGRVGKKTIPLEYGSAIVYTAECAPGCTCLCTRMRQYLPEQRRS